MQGAAYGISIVNCLKKLLTDLFTLVIGLYVFQSPCVSGQLVHYSKSGMEEAEFYKLHSGVKRGDIVGVTGFPGLSSAVCSSFFFFGEITLHLLHLQY